ncbi:MAG: gluconokinase [Burkholderiales bacterium]|nr:gluconokinase [Burkholderiales bacterium]
MGVAGCGKSSLARAVAAAEGLPMIEGDAHHSATSVAKMSQGIALTDADRAGWLDLLADLLQQHADGVVLTCSALKLAYRQRLRAAVPGLRFAWLDIGHADALARVSGRGDHFFSSSLVDSQFEALQPPNGECGVLRLDARLPPEQLQADVSAWLNTPLETRP